MGNAMGCRCHPERKGFHMPAEKGKKEARLDASLCNSPFQTSAGWSMSIYLLINKEISWPPMLQY